MGVFLGTADGGDVLGISDGIGLGATYGDVLELGALLGTGSFWGT